MRSPHYYPSTLPLNRTRLQQKKYVVREIEGTPLVVASSLDGSLLIKGNYNSRHPELFVYDVLQLIDSFYADGNQIKSINVLLFDLSIGSSQWIVKLLGYLKEKMTSYTAGCITWFYPHGQEEALIKGKVIEIYSEIQLAYESLYKNDVKYLNKVYGEYDSYMKNKSTKFFQ